MRIPLRVQLPTEKIEIIDKRSTPYIRKILVSGGVWYMIVGYLLECSYIYIQGRYIATCQSQRPSHTMSRRIFDDTEVREKGGCFMKQLPH